MSQVLEPPAVALPVEGWVIPEIKLNSFQCGNCGVISERAEVDEYEDNFPEGDNLVTCPNCNTPVRFVVNSYCLLRTDAETGERQYSVVLK